MKRYTLPTVAAFHTRQHAILSAYPDRSPWGLHPYRVMTRFGRLEIHPESLEKGDQTTAVCCRFLDADLRRGAPFPTNPHNGKWVLICADPQKALDDLEAGLTRAEARPLTDEERAAWEVEDRAQAEYYGKLDEYLASQTEPATHSTQTA